jgi:hypothetical protein
MHIMINIRFCNVCQYDILLLFIIQVRKGKSTRQLEDYENSLKEWYYTAAGVNDEI